MRICSTIHSPPQKKKKLLASYRNYQYIFARTYTFFRISFFPSFISSDWLETNDYSRVPSSPVCRCISSKLMIEWFWVVHLSKKKNDRNCSFRYTIVLLFQHSKCFNHTLIRRHVKTPLNRIRTYIVFCVKNIYLLKLLLLY